MRSAPPSSPNEKRANEPTPSPHFPTSLTQTHLPNTTKQIDVPYLPCALFVSHYHLARPPSVRLFCINLRLSQSFLYSFRWIDVGRVSHTFCSSSLSPSLPLPPSPPTSIPSPPRMRERVCTIIASSLFLCGKFNDVYKLCLFLLSFLLFFVRSPFIFPFELLRTEVGGRVHCTEPFSYSFWVCRKPWFTFLFGPCSPHGHGIVPFHVSVTDRQPQATTAKQDTTA